MIKSDKNIHSANTKKLVTAAMLFAIGLVLPFLTGQIPQVGSMLLPMHIPVFLCGLICGWKYGLLVGLLLPLTRSALFAMPPVYPTAVAMAFELGTYGLVAGLVYYAKDYRCMKALLRAMIAAMIAGRLVWAAAMTVLMGLEGNVFTFELFLTGAVLNAIPGIILQFFLIPAVMVALDRTKLLKFSEKTA